MLPDLADPALPILYSFRRCPYAIRARLAIKASGVAVALREVVLRHKPAALVAASAKATVPVLQLPDGRVLEESLDIMRWALAMHDPHDWHRASEQPEVQAWVDLNDGPFKQALDGYKYASDPAARPALACRDDAVVTLLVPMEKGLADRRFLLRDTPSMADMALLPFVRQFAAVDPPWFKQAPLPHLQVWLKGLLGTPLFEAVMRKQAVWQSGDDAVIFP